MEVRTVGLFVYGLTVGGGGRLYPIIGGLFPRDLLKNLDEIGVVVKPDLLCDFGQGIGGEGEQLARLFYPHFRDILQGGEGGRFLERPIAVRAPTSTKC